MSKIEWTEKTWSSITGCDKISSGCANCYAERMSNRLHHMGLEKYKNNFNVTVHPELFGEPLKWKKGKMIFVCSMSDLFHRDVPDSAILEIFKTMNEAKQHTFQVLTKRPDRLIGLNDKITWTKNIWMGVTVENAKAYHRVKYLRENCNAHVKFLSLEPLIGHVGDLSLFDGIDQVIVGGESGPGARPMEKWWIDLIWKQCQDNGVPFFFKQWGGKNKKKSGRLYRGREWNEMPHSAKELV